MTRPLSPAYQTAIAAHNLAVADFRLVQLAYRSRQIDDATFLACRRAYEVATMLFDAAWERELHEHAAEDQADYDLSHKT